MSKFNIGQVVRYGSGPTALMRITGVSKDHGGFCDRYYGIQFYGSAEGRYEDQLEEGSAQDLLDWVKGDDLTKDRKKREEEEFGPEEEIENCLQKVKEELSKAIQNWPPMNSAHEAYGVLLEEVDELWDHVKTKQKNRDLEEMKKECIQVAAMALRFAVEVCNEKRGRK